MSSLDLRYRQGPRGILQRAGHRRAILWHQGESDYGDGLLAAGSDDGLAGTVQAPRAGLGAEVPFVAGELGCFLDRATSTGGS